MNLHDLKPDPGSNKKKIRRGRGRGARRGESAGRGNKGQKKRSKVPSYFEGGQTPIYRRFPKRGFNRTSTETVEEVNVGSLNRFDGGATVAPEDFLQQGLINALSPVKLLGDGELDVALTVQVHRVSDGARKKVTSAGGTVELLDDKSTSRDA